jgi:hypothetical protein
MGKLLPFKICVRSEMQRRQSIFYIIFHVTLVKNYGKNSSL